MLYAGLFVFLLEQADFLSTANGTNFKNDPIAYFSLKGWKSFESSSCCSTSSVAQPCKYWPHLLHLLIQETSTSWNWNKIVILLPICRKITCTKNSPISPLTSFTCFAATTIEYGYTLPKGRRLEYGFRPHTKKRSWFVSIFGGKFQMNKIPFLMSLSLSVRWHGSMKSMAW